MKAYWQRVYASRHNPNWIIACVFLYFCILSALLPYMHDDWAWGSSIGLDRLDRLFANYNGRWAGNLLVLLLTRVPFLRILAYGASMAVIVLYAWKLTGGKRVGLLWSIAFLLCIPHTMFAQVIAWTSGFVNYTVSVALLLPLLYHVWKRLTRDENRKWFSTLGMAVLCFAAALFIEHITVYLLLLLLAANSLFLLRRKRIDVQLLALLIAAAAGAALMFSNTAYHSAASSADQYQQIQTGSISFMIGMAVDRYFEEIVYYFFLNNLILTLALSIIGLAVLLVRRPKGYLLPAGIMILMLVYQLARKWLPFNMADTYWGQRTVGLLCLLFLFSLGYIMWNISEIRWKGLLLLGSAVILTAPLLLVEPIGARNFFVVYVFQSLAAVLLCAWLLKWRGEKVWYGVTAKAAVCVCAICSVFYLSIFSTVSRAAQTRLYAVEEQVAQGQSEIGIKALPYPEYMHGSTPINDRFMKRFKLFYGLPESLEITITGK